jgi:hypothetical protein
MSTTFRCGSGWLHGIFSRPDFLWCNAERRRYNGKVVSTSDQNISCLWIWCEHRTEKCHLYSYIVIWRTSAHSSAGCRLRFGSGWSAQDPWNFQRICPAASANHEVRPPLNIKHDALRAGRVCWHLRATAIRRKLLGCCRLLYLSSPKVISAKISTNLQDLHSQHHVGDFLQSFTLTGHWDCTIVWHLAIKRIRSDHDPTFLIGLSP